MARVKRWHVPDCVTKKGIQSCRVSSSGPVYAIRQLAMSERPWRVIHELLEKDNRNLVSVTL